MTASLHAFQVVSRSQTLTPREGEGSGKVLYIELSQRVVRGTTNQIASLWHYIVCGGVLTVNGRDTINTLYIILSFSI